MAHRTVRIPADLYLAVSGTAESRGCTLGEVLADALIRTLPALEIAAARRRYAATSRITPPERPEVAPERLPRPPRPTRGPEVPEPPPERLPDRGAPHEPPPRPIDRSRPVHFRTPELRPRKVEIAARPSYDWQLPPRR